MAQDLRPLGLLATAQWETIFPPPSPTHARRLKGKPHHAPAFLDMVAILLDAQTNPNELTKNPDFVRAVQTSDAKHFARLTKAAEYIKEMPHASSVFAKHVIAARTFAAKLMQRDGCLPTMLQVRRRVSNYLKADAYTEPEDWSRVWKAAGLSDLAHASSARTGHKQTA